MTEKKYCLGPRQEAFVHGLESTTIPQIVGSLKLRSYEGDKYCAVGFAIKDHWEESGVVTLSKKGYNLGRYGFASDYYNATALGINNIVEMNDKLQLSFKQIAAEIRADPKKFFEGPV